LARKIDAQDAGTLLGLLHDFGKYGRGFQDYIQSATGMLDPDRDDTWVDADRLKGKIDHSSAGAQYIWKQCVAHGGDPGKLVGQVLAVVLASHHGGLMDCLRDDGGNGFLKRMAKKDDLTHLQECLASSDTDIVSQISALASEDTFKEVWEKIIAIAGSNKKEHNRLLQFRLGFFTRFLFSCLIDADRLDSADFENPDNKTLRRPAPACVSEQEHDLRLAQKGNPDA
jgi:CRISPR-associated endonuclease/helicase Cas3